MRSPRSMARASRAAASSGYAAARQEARYQVVVRGKRVAGRNIERVVEQEHRPWIVSKRPRGMLPAWKTPYSER
jgi:hypothetical protein